MLNYYFGKKEKKSMYLQLNSGPWGSIWDFSLEVSTERGNIPELMALRGGVDAVVGESPHPEYLPELL